MGAILSSFLNPDLPSDIVIDFDRLEKPTNAAELELFQLGQDIIEQAQAQIIVVESYQGCEQLIRQSMAQPQNEALQLQCFEGMFPNVNRIKDYFKLAKSMEDFVKRTCKLCSSTGATQPGLLKTLATVFNFALKLDRAKMMHPALQNDFSQYRRALSKQQRHPGLPVVETDANTISMFLAQSSPVTYLMCSGLTSGGDAAANAKFLADFAHICCAFVMREKQPGTHAVFALTAMTVCFLLYDAIMPSGVFAKGGAIDVKSCVQQLKQLRDVETRQVLCDTLHYSTRSFDKAPDAVKRILETRG